jgi:CRISPR-associated helicase Cas3
VKHPNASQLLYPHQAATLDAWRERDSFLLVTKTGTGKTAAAVLPVLKYRQRAVCVYPTNELIQDQVRNVVGIAAREGVRTCVQTAETQPEEYASADVIVVRIDADSLEQYRKKRHLSHKWRALKELLEADKPKIVLTNPDVLFLIFALQYRAESLAALQAYDALIVDEFHLYSGVELAHALFMVHLGRSLKAFRKVALLSATPGSEDIGGLLDHVLDAPMKIDSSAECSYPVVGERRALEQVEVIPYYGGDAVVEAAVVLIRQLCDELPQRRRSTPEPHYVPAVIVVNSVVNAIRLEDRLVEEGLVHRQDMAIIRGLSTRRIRDTRGKLVAVGTSAIEVGIDFHCDYLVFEASEASSFMQRFGRIGRHNPGTAYVLAPSNVMVGLEGLRKEKGYQVERADFEERVYSWYPSLETRAWFARTLMVLLSCFTLAENLVKRVRDDFRASPEHVAVAESQMEEFCGRYGERIGCAEKLVQQATQHIRSIRQHGRQHHDWLVAYRELNTFRTSLPSECVLDFAELERRGGNWDNAKYTTDVATLLRRAECLRFNDRVPHPDGGMGMLTVKGYGRYKRVWVTPTFTEDQCGVLRCTSDFPDLSFIQEGHKTSVSHVMTLRDHVFVVVPRSILPDLDWRLPVFECGRHLVAFDGVAFLLWELMTQR